MSDIADNVLATLDAVNSLAAQVNALAAAVSAITPVAVDLSEVNGKLDVIIADLNPTPVA